MEILLLLSLTIASAINKAIWGVEEYVREESRPLRSKIAQSVEKQAKSDNYKYGPGDVRTYWWLANALAWLTGKTVKHGVGVAKVIGSSAKEGHRDARAIFDWAKTELEIRKARKEADRINQKVAWDDLDEAHKKAIKEDKRRTRLLWEDLVAGLRKRHAPQQEAPQARTPEDEIVDAELVDDTAPAAPQPAIAPIFAPPKQLASAPEPSGDTDMPPWLIKKVDSSAPEAPLVKVDVPEGTVLPKPAPAPVAAPAPAVEVEVVKPTTPAAPAPAPAPVPAARPASPVPSGSTTGINGARQALAQLMDLVATEATEAEHRRSNSLVAARRLASVKAAVDKIVGGLASYDVDEATLTDARQIAARLHEMEMHAKAASNEEYRTSQAGVGALGAAEAARSNLELRHGGVAAAVSAAPVSRTAVREFYEDNGGGKPVPPAVAALPR